MNAFSTRVWALSLASLFVLLAPITVASASSEGALVLRPTKVVVQCRPGSLLPGKTTECLITVSDNAAGKKEAPAGTVTLTTNGPGVFDAPTCTLTPAVTASRCTAHYTPARIGIGTHTITASYPGSEIHAASSNRAAVFVTPPNDDRRAAERLAPPPSSIEGTLVGATNSYSDPEAECADVEGTVWYRLTATKLQRIAIRLKAHGKLDAAIAVFQPVRSKYRTLGCAATNVKGIAGVSFDARRGSRYLVLVGAQEDSARSTFRLELFAPPVATPPGATLPARGARSVLDPLTKPEEAWSRALVAGRTYRINLAPDRGECLSLSLYAPGTKSFAYGAPLRRASCGGYQVFTPGPDGGGRYSLLVETKGGSGRAQRYRLHAALAGADDTAPGISVSNHEKRRGSLSGRGVDVVDLYRFEISHLSDVTLRYSRSRGLDYDLLLVSSIGSLIDRASSEGGGKLRRQLDEGEYYVAFRARQQTAGPYAFSLLAREITKTTVTIDGSTEATATPGRWVSLGALVTPTAAVGGPIRLQVDRFDPIEGWQFVRLFNAPVGSGGRVTVSWKPPSIGRWRLHAVFMGSHSASPSKSGYAYVVVQSSSGT